MLNKIREILTEYSGNGKSIKVLLAVLLVSTAFLFFDFYGENPGEEAKAIQVEEPDDAANTVESEGIMYIDISGEVKNPGVYELETGSRVFEAIDKAGGLTDDSDTSSINQAEVLTDGTKITIPSRSADNGSQHISGGESDDELININSADSSKLQEIPGVGPVTAEKIIDHRVKNGPFTDINELKEINGIGDKTFEKMKDLIKI